MSQDPFDPYFKWLGIAPKDQPPTHYRLLGIDDFTEDEDVISIAADRQMMLLRTFQQGERAADSQRLLNEIAAARAILLHTIRKGQYDKQLLARRGSPVLAPAVKESTVATRPPAPPGTPIQAVPMQAPASGNHDSTPPLVAAEQLPLQPLENSPQFIRQQLPTAPAKHRRQKNSAGLFWIIGIGVGAVLLLVVAVAASKLITESEDPVAEAPVAEVPVGEESPADQPQTGPGPTSAAASTIDWRAVGDRKWEVGNNEIYASKEMQPGSWLMSRAMFGDCLVTFDYVMESDGAGGVYLRVPADATWPWKKGLEVHLKDDYGTSALDHESTGSIWHRTPPSTNASMPTGHWNKVRIECRGLDINVEINGKEVASYRMDDRMPRKGHVGLDGVSGGIRYRKFQVAPLP